VEVQKEITPQWNHYLDIASSELPGTNAQIGTANQALKNPLKVWIKNQYEWVKVWVPEPAPGHWEWKESYLASTVTFKALSAGGLVDGQNQVSQTTVGGGLLKEFGGNGKVWESVGVNYTCGSKTEPQIIEARYTYGEPYNRITGAPAWEAPEEKVYFAVGVPEVYLVRETTPGVFEQAKYLLSWNPFTQPIGDATKYYIEAKMPLTEPTTIQSGINSGNICQDIVTQINGAIGQVGVDRLPLERISTYDRYALYRTPINTPFVYIDETLPEGVTTPPSLPPGPTYVQVGWAGFGLPFVYGEEPITGTPHSVLKVILTDTYGKVEEDKKFVEAQLPREKAEPKKSLFSAILKGTDKEKIDVPAKIIYKRNGAEAEVIWSGPKPEIIFNKAGILNHKIRLVDGPEALPTAIAGSIDIQPAIIISGVQQGDTIIIEEQSEHRRDKAAIVKNFTWNDLQRLQAEGKSLTFAPEFNLLSPTLKTNIINTILFSLDTALPNQQLNNQSWQREVWEQNLTGTGLATLNIPSAMGVGIFPDDMSHGHLALSSEVPDEIKNAVKELSNLKGTKAQELKIDALIKVPYDSPNYRDKYQKLYEALTNALKQMLTVYCGGDKPFVVYHTYELPFYGVKDEDNAKYIDPEGKRILKPGDPIRNIKTGFAATQPQLFVPPKINDASSWEQMPNTKYVTGISFFVNKEKQIIILPSYIGLVESLQVIDALDK